MFARILYPTDFSDATNKALGYIKQLREGGAKEVILLHVIDERAVEAVHRYVTESSFEKLENMMKEETEQSFTKIEEELKKCGLEVRKRIRIGNPLREILKTEEEEDVSLIVIGSHGRSNLEEMLLGSVSEKVIRKCKKPVLVIKR
jgi:nucleotide-binding universal stress UspA family protein